MFTHLPPPIRYISELLINQYKEQKETHTYHCSKFEINRSFCFDFRLCVLSLAWWDRVFVSAILAVRIARNLRGNLRCITPLRWVRVAKKKLETQRAVQTIVSAGGSLRLRLLASASLLVSLSQVPGYNRVSYSRGLGIEGLRNFNIQILIIL